MYFKEGEKKKFIDIKKKVLVDLKKGKKKILSQSIEEQYGVSLPLPETQDFSPNVNYTVQEIAPVQHRKCNASALSVEGNEVT